MAGVRTMAHRNLGWLAAVGLVWGLAACGSDTAEPADVAVEVADVAADGAADVAGDPAAEATVETAVEATPEVVPEVAEETTSEVAVDVLPEAITPPVAWGPENRGYAELRGIVHLHSLYSHDGCIGNHEDVPADQVAQFFGDCLKQYRAAPCQAGIDYMMQSDHPSNVKEQTFEDAVHYQPADGDELVNDEQGRVLANKMTCAEGSAVKRAYFFLGTEGTKNLPIGVSKTATAENGWKSVDPQIFDVSYDNTTGLVQAQTAIAAVHASGGFAFVAHPEMSDLSVDTIKALPLDGMEIFNIHPMLTQALQDNLPGFFRVDAFMTPGADNPHPDLGLMAIMAPVPNDPLKFDQAAPFIRLASFGATDIHRNVEVPAFCQDGLEDGGMCQNLAAQYPHFAQLLIKGGPAILSDGERFDAYDRAFRWLANRTLVKSDATNEAVEIRQSIGTGRSYLAFDLYGAPKGFDFFAWADGAAVEMGREIQGAADVTLYVRAPTLVATPWGGMKHVTDYSTGEIETKLYRATKDGSEVVADVHGQGATLSFKAEQAAAYRVEIWITPKHLVPTLKGVEDFAAVAYPYIYSNAIFVR